MLYNYLVAGTEPPAKVIPVVGKLLTPDDAK
jgi:ribose transport system substrate-binding protein